MKQIICIGFTSWEGDFAKSTVQLVSRISSDYHTVYIDYQYTFKDLFTNLRKKHNFDFWRIIGFKNRIRILSDKLKVFTPPPVLPINWLKPDSTLFFLSLKLNTWIIFKSLKRKIKSLGFESPIVINAFNPVYGYFLINKFNEQKRIYYCYDDINSSSWANRHGGIMEQKYIPKVDHVVTISEALLQSKKNLNPSISLIRNGVDFSFFNKALKNNNNKRPIIGYVGSVDERVNYMLIDHIARRLTNYNFHFYGRIMNHKDIENLESLENVTFFGAKPYHKIPEVINTFDIGIIPFALTEFNKSIYPLKINEYFALGKPVVMTNFATFKDFEHLVSIANTPDMFVDYIDDSIKNNSPQAISDRISFAKRNSWDGKVKEFVNIIES